MRKTMCRFYILLSICVLFVTASSVNLVTRLEPDSTALLTPDGAHYQMSVTGNRISISSTQSGRNNREIYWDKDSMEYVRSRQCATWTSGTDIAQNGMVFRLQQKTDGYTAVVFARNIFMNWYWVFAPKIFHTGSDYTTDWDSPDGVDLSAYLGHLDHQDFPLRVCAELDSTDVLHFAVAKRSDPMPPLNTPGIQGGEWKLNLTQYFHGDDGRRGKNGIFAGHIPNGTSLVFDDVTLSNLSDE